VWRVGFLPRIPLRLLPVAWRQANFPDVILETALADALYLNWAIPAAALAPAPVGLRYDTVERGGESLAFFSLVLFRQVGLHPRGASWLGLSYPQVDARLCVRDAANTGSVLLLRQLVPGWVVPIGRLVTGQPFSAAVCLFPGGLPQDSDAEKAAGDREWRWSLSAGAPFSAVAHLGGTLSSRPGSTPQESAAGIAFFRDRTRTYWRQGDALRRSESEPPATTVLPVEVRIERAGWLESFIPFAPGRGWSELYSAFLVPRVQAVFALAPEREVPVAAPVAAAG